ncbi:hypothetical protein THASP1DRAFT_31016 [Thamnocephalis sphaerospora]|uniref:Uncharacterized protein n=1 Tax=Thamnocephalis sphaerospora TaxID=78915 RepID=A0A4P9XMP6_9FUNG|nr:hypothetical protein THASP1DRAFT_31016 [Thamnocephalis sphaerospora]|eukprot:RKP07165.1 hypothetical protein THASP1DRAFT_31016 [Thamnocephalis sphaerospora]
MPRPAAYHRATTAAVSRIQSPPHYHSDSTTHSVTSQLPRAAEAVASSGGLGTSPPRRHTISGRESGDSHETSAAFGVRTLATAFGTTRRIVFYEHANSAGFAAHGAGRIDGSAHSAAAAEQRLADVAAHTARALSTWSRTMDDQCDSFFARHKIINCLLVWLCLLALDAVIHWPGRLEWVGLWVLSLLVMYRALQVSTRLLLAVAVLHAALDAAVWTLLCRPASQDVPLAGFGAEASGTGFGRWWGVGTGVGWTWPWYWSSSGLCTSLADLVVYSYGAPLARGFDPLSWLLWAVLVATDLGYRGPRLASTATTLASGPWRILPVHAIGHGIYMFLSLCVRALVSLRHRHLARRGALLASPFIPAKSQKQETSTGARASPSELMSSVASSFTPNPLFYQPRVLLRDDVVARRRASRQLANGNADGASSTSYASASDSERARSQTGTPSGHGSARTRRRNGRTRSDTMSSSQTTDVLSQDTLRSPLLPRGRSRERTYAGASHDEDDALGHGLAMNGTATSGAAYGSYAHAQLTARLEVLDSFELCVVGLSAYTATFAWIFPPSLIRTLDARPIDAAMAAAHGWKDDLADSPLQPTPAVSESSTSSSVSAQHEFSPSQPSTSALSTTTTKQIIVALERLSGKEVHANDLDSEDEEFRLTQQLMWLCGIRDTSARDTETASAPPTVSDASAMPAPPVYPRAAPTVVVARDLTIRVDDILWSEVDLDPGQATVTVYGLRPATEYRITMSLAGYRSTPARICTDARPNGKQMALQRNSIRTKPNDVVCAATALARTAGTTLPITLATTPAASAAAAVAAAAAAAAITPTECSPSAGTAAHSVGGILSPPPSPPHRLVHELGSRYPMDGDVDGVDGVATASATADHAPETIITPAPLMTMEDPLRETREALERELQQAADAKQDAQARLRKLRRTLQRAENQQRSETEALQRAIARSAAQDAKNRQRVQFLQDLLRRTQVRIDELVEEVARARDEHTTVAAETASKDEALEAVRAQHRDAEQRHQRQTAAAGRQTRELQTRLQAAVQARDDTRVRLERLRDQQLPALVRDRAELTHRTAEATARVEELRQLHESRGRQSAARDKEEGAGTAQVRREITAAQERNQSLQLLARDESAFRDRLRNELSNLHDRSRRSASAEAEANSEDCCEAGCKPVASLLKPLADRSARSASVPSMSTTSPLLSPLAPTETGDRTLLAADAH